MTGLVYVQSTGELLYDGALWGVGYSGKGVGKNNPAAQEVHNVGPIPQGQYTIGATYDGKTQPNGHNTGPCTIGLVVLDRAAAFDRDEFRIHGDNATHDASEGCIIMGRVVRQRITPLQGQTLTVVASYPVESKKAEGVS